MKKMKALLTRISFGKRAVGLCLALALMLGVFSGIGFDLFSVPVSAGEEKPYYGDRPGSNGYYYWNPSGRGYFAVPSGLSRRSDLFNEFNHAGLIWTQSDVNSRVDYSAGYGPSQLRYYGRVDMAEKWKISSFNVTFSMALLSDYYAAYKKQPLSVLVTFTNTYNNGSSYNYYFDGRRFSRGVPTINDFVYIKNYANQTSEEGRKLGVFTAPLASSVGNIKAIFAEENSAYVNSWHLQNRDNDTPLFWMVFQEELFPVDENVLNRELLGKTFNIEIAMTPRVDPNGTPKIVRAKCTEFVSSDRGEPDGTGHGKLGFEINEEDWASLQETGQEWVIRTVYPKFDTSVSYKIKYPYPIKDYVKPLPWASSNFNETVYPIVDTVGNPVVIMSSYSNINIEIDTVDPIVTQVTLKGDSLPASNTSNLKLDSWEDTTDLNWKDLFAGKDDTLYATVELNEKIRSLTDEQKKQVYLEWNVKDKNGDPVRTYLTGQTVAAYVNGSSDITQLTFAPLKIGILDPEESGKQIKPVKLHGAEYLQDFTNNSMTEITDPDGGVYTISVSPDKQVYFDLKGPIVTLGNIIRNEDSSGDFVTYSVEVNFSDTTSEESGRYFAGMVGGESNVMGSFSMYTGENIPSFNYSYSLIYHTETFNGEYASTGTLTGKGAQSPSPLKIVNEGKYILHLKIESADGVEIPDDTGVVVDFTMWDILDNRSEQTVVLTNLALDKVAPTLTVKESSEINASIDGNSATFGATLSASDLNKISLIEYKWGSETDIKQIPQDGKSVTYEIPSKTLNGSGLVEDTLEITVYDKHNNSTTKKLTFSADLSKYVPQFSYSGDPYLPAHTNDVIISAPISTEDGGTVDGYVRVIYYVEATNEYYIGTAKVAKDQTISLFGDELTWIKTTVSGNKYGAVTSVSDITFLTDIYGELEITVWASKTDLAIIEGAAVDPSLTDTYAQKTSAALARTSKRDDVHNLIFGDVTLASGEKLEASTFGEGEGALDYHKLFINKFVGTRYPFSIANAICPEWTTVDLDYTGSYAVLLKVNSDGTLPETDVEVTDRISLSAGLDQCLVIPGLDKDGNAFTTGVYVWKIHIAQKAGGSQDIIAPDRFLLDAVELDAEFGVYSYTGYVSFGCDSYNVDVGTDYTQKGMYLVQENEDGSPLSVINVAMAKSADPVIVKDELGNDAYAYVHVNETKFLEFEIVINKDKLEEQTYMGEELGVIEGFRYWNANAPVNLDELPFELDIIDDGIRGLTVDQDLRSYMVDQYIVVDDLSKLAPATSHKDFRVTEGKNRIAYQMKLTNGEISPVMYIDVILRTTAPSVSVSFTPGVGRDEVIDSGDGNVLVQYHTNSVTASVVDFTSVSGTLDFYQLTFEDHGHYTIYKYQEIADPSNITLTRGSDGYEGLPNDYYSDAPIGDYFMAVDGYGNAVIVLPILGDMDNVGDERFKTLVIPELGKIGSLTRGDAYKYDVSEEGVYRINISHAFTNEDDDSIYRAMDGYSVQLDDGEPVYVDARGLIYEYDEEGYIIGFVDYNEQILNSPNAAGISRVYDNGGVNVSFPYDPETPLGETSTHKVTVRAYMNGQETDSATLYLYSVPNLRPTLIPEREDIGETTITSRYTDLTDEQLANGEYYSANGIRFGYGQTKLSGDTDYYESHSLVTVNGGLYTVEFMDKHGNMHSQEILIDLPDDPKVTFSTTDPTAGPVVVTITSEQYELYVATMANESYPDDDRFAVPEGTVIEGNGTKTLTLTLYNNSDYFNLPHPENENEGYGYYGIPVSYGENGYLAIKVKNIYNQPIAPVVQWTYNAADVYETYVRNGTTYENVVIGVVDAFLMDENGIPLIDPTTGETPRITFYPGGATTHTFSGYTNIVGAVGEDVTVTLPVTLLDHVDLSNVTETEPVEDIWSPNVAINGNAVYSEGVQSVNAAYVNATARTAESPIADLVEAWTSDWTDTYGEDMVFTDSNDLIAYYGWAETYRLNLNILDEGKTKIFITNTDYTSTPTFEGGSSDDVAGVTVIGNAIVITENASFVIHVVDEADNAVSIPILTTAVGTDAPMPGHVVAIGKDGSSARVYLTLPNVDGAANLQITTGTFEPDPNAKTETDENSSFYGMPYAVYTENGVKTLYYSYELNGHRVTGSVSVKIEKIDKSVMSVLSGYPKWSGNFDPSATADNLSELWVRMTNQSITAQFSFNKTIGDVYFTDENGSKIDVAHASVAFLGKQATVEYIANESALKLVVVSATNADDVCIIDLPAIVTVDKVAPDAFESVVSYSSDRRSAVITLKVNEQATLQSNGKYLTLVEGESPYYTLTKEVKANGEYTFILVDRAGNRTEKTVSVTDILTGGLTMQISSSPDDSAILDPDTFIPEAGSSVYVKVNRDAEITVDNSDVSSSAEAGQWVEITLTESLSGLYPTIRAMDVYGNTAVIQLASVPIRDGKAPSIIILRDRLTVDQDISDIELEQLLRANILASDDSTAEDQLIFSFNYNRPATSGTVSVSYSVTDSSGNTATENGAIRFSGTNDLVVKVNDELAESDQTIIVQKGSIDLFVDTKGEPYKIMWKDGVKTVAQVKINATTLTPYTDQAQSYAPAFTEEGYYTIVITTQSQLTYRIILYVEN